MMVRKIDMDYNKSRLILVVFLHMNFRINESFHCPNPLSLKIQSILFPAKILFILLLLLNFRIMQFYQEVNINA